MNPKIEELKGKKEKAETELEQLQHRQQRLENRLRYYEAGERKARAHRLIERGATVESIWPNVKDLSKVDYDKLMRKVLALPDAKNVLREFVKAGK